MSSSRTTTVPAVRDMRWSVHRQWVETLDGDHVYVVNPPEPTKGERRRYRREELIVKTASMFLFGLVLLPFVVRLFR